MQGSDILGGISLYSPADYSPEHFILAFTSYLIPHHSHKIIIPSQYLSTQFNCREHNNSCC